MAFPFAGLGALAGGIGSLAGAFGFGGGGQSASSAYMSQLPQLAAQQIPMQIAGQQLMALMTPYLGAQAAQTNLYGQSVYDVFKGSTSRDAQMAGLQTGIASQLAGAAISQQEMASKGRTALELQAGETQSELAKKAGDNLGLQYATVAKGLTDVGTNAGLTRNQQMLETTKSNLRIGEQLAGIKGQTEANMALRRQAAGMALAPNFA